MAAPLATFLNSTEAKINWDPESFHHGGPVSHYEVRISYQRTGNVHNILLPANGSNHVTVNLDRLSEEQVSHGGLIVGFLIAIVTRIRVRLSAFAL